MTDSETLTLVLFFFILPWNFFSFKGISYVFLMISLKK